MTGHQSLLKYMAITIATVMPNDIPATKPMEAARTTGSARISAMAESPEGVGKGGG